MRATSDMDLAVRTPGCLDAETLAAYVDGRLAPDEVSRADTHIDDCGSCRGELSAIAAVQTLRAAIAPTGAGDDAAGDSPSGRLGRYVVLRELGRGGMGVVVRAYDPELARSVAVKVLAPGLVSQFEPAAREQLRREAQAMARLTHPNVVTVYDVITEGDRIFVAMELVEGETLRGFLRTRRPWREALAVCVRAGRGLAAAHDARLVHRDFKPENVLRSSDGRVLVSDFGLARPLDDRTVLGDGAAPLATALAGTPAYMAPELYRGEPASPRSDQFSFCVATYEALYGERPFAGDTVPALRDSVTAGVVRDPPAGTRVPPWVRRVVVRGLAVEPDQRYPAMAPLLDALERDPGTTRRRRLALVGALALAVAVGAAVVPSASAPVRCEIGDRDLDGVWDGPRRQAVARALAATGRRDAADTTQRVDAALDGYTHGWLATRRAACEATRVRGVQSEQVLDLRIACLDRGRRELGELTAILADVDPALVDRAVGAVYHLHDPAACTADGVRADALPTDPGRRAAVERGRADLDRAWAMLAAGRPAAAVPIADSVIAADAAPQLHAEALLVRSQTQTAASTYDVAEATLFDALTAAEQARDDQLVARIWVELVEVTGSQQHRFDLAASNARAADAALARVDVGPRLQFRHAYATGTMLLAQGKLDLASDRLDRALALASPDLPGDPGTVHTALCDVERQRGKLDAGREHCRLAIAQLEQAYGAGSPAVAIALNTSGALESAARRWDDAARAYARAITIYEGAGQVDNVTYALAISNLGTVHMNEGRADLAAPLFERASALFAAHHPDHPQRVLPLQGLAGLAYAHSDFTTAIARYQEALALIEKVYDPDSPACDTARFNLALAYGRHAEPARATELLDIIIARSERPGHENWVMAGRALIEEAQIVERADPQNGVALCRRALEALDKTDELEVRAWSLYRLATIYRHLHQPALALDPLQRSLAFYAGEGTDPYEQGVVEYALAKAMTEAGVDRPAAIAHGRAAAASLARARGAPNLEAVQAELAGWLRTHPAK